ncbi:MAG: NAD(P)/FAD-dependent oxidoreductase [Firmicutes bacterium]|nr:NAD(P)/FAD-dependent oxidoreductase [Bacillota bacterium]
MYDAIIVGSGPAAVSAALTLKLHEKSFCIFGSRAMSRKVESSEKIANYPGVPMTTGAALNAAFAGQMEQMGIEITERMVTAITATRRGFLVLADNDIFDCKTVLLATGAVSAKGYPGEEALLGRGVSYCATCDGFLYKGKTIAVYCGDARFANELRYLAQLADRVYAFGQLDGVAAENICCPTQKLRAVLGEERVRAIALSDGSEIAVDGVFVLRNAVAPAALVKGLAMDGPHISVNRRMETNMPGLFAAGDCTGRPYQITKAVGEGNVAAHAMLKLLGQQ